MALNFPGPQEVRLNYTCNLSGLTLQHQARYNVALQGAFGPGGVFSDYDVFEQSGITQDLQAAVDAWVALLQPLFNSAATNFVSAELWDYNPGTFESSFLSVYDINLPGTSGSGGVVTGQTIYTFRSQEGGIMKISLMEGITLAGASVAYSSLSAAQKAMVDKVVSSTNIFQARDTSFPFAFVLCHPGNNEATFKRRFRPF